MQEIQAHFVELANKGDKSIFQIAKEAGVAESTVRRFLRGDDISVNSLGKIAAAIGGTTVDLNGLIPDKTAVAVEIVKQEVKQEIEQEFKPYSPHCATDCTARRRFDENLNTIKELYETRLAEHKQVIAEKNERIKRFRIAAYILLGLFAFAVAFVFYLIFIDFANPAWGIFQYPTALWENWQDIVPQVFKL